MLSKPVAESVLVLEQLTATHSHNDNKPTAFVFYSSTSFQPERKFDFPNAFYHLPLNISEQQEQQQATTADDTRTSSLTASSAASQSNSRVSSEAQQVKTRKVYYRSLEENVSHLPGPATAKQKLHGSNIAGNATLNAAPSGVNEVNREEQSANTRFSTVTSHVPSKPLQHPRFWTGLVSSYTLTLFTEFGDRTFFVSTILALRLPRYSVFWGSWSALVLQTVFSTLVGRLLHLFPSKASKNSFFSLPLDDYAAAAFLFVFGISHLCAACQTEQHSVEQLERDEAYDSKQQELPSQSTKPSNSFPDKYYLLPETRSGDIDRDRVDVLSNATTQNVCNTSAEDPDTVAATPRSRQSLSPTVHTKRRLSVRSIVENVPRSPRRHHYLLGLATSAGDTPTTADKPLGNVFSEQLMLGDSDHGLRSPLKPHSSQSSVVGSLEPGRCATELKTVTNEYAEAQKAVANIEVL